MMYATEEPLEIKTQHGPPPSKVSWAPYQLNAKHPIMNTEQWEFVGTRFLSKSSNNLNLRYDPWFRRFRKWCMDDRVWTKDAGRGPHDWIPYDDRGFYRFTTVEQKHIMLWCE
jgi:hypothetical protein